MLLFANVKDTSSSSGNGNLTLSGTPPSGFETVDSRYGQGPQFGYIARHDSLDEWEEGVAHLSAATTMVRDYCVNNHNNNQTKVSFSTGGLTIVAFPISIFLADWSFGKVHPNSERPNETSGLVSFSSANVTLTANSLAVAPIWLPAGKKFDGLGVRITTGAGTGSNKLRCGIWEHNRDTGELGELLEETADLDPSSTGDVFGSFTARYLTGGLYWTGVVSDVAPAILAQQASQSAQVCGPIGVRAGTNGATGGYLAKALGSWTTLPNAPTSFSTAVGWKSKPAVFVSYA